MRKVIAFGLTLAGLSLVIPCGLRAADATACTYRLELANGEVLVGTLVSEEEGAFVFRSQTWGGLRVPKAGSHLSVIAAPAKEPAGKATDLAKAQTPSSPTEKPHAPTPAASAAASPPVAKWKKSLEAGYSYQARGNLVSAYSTYVRGEITREDPNSLITFGTRYIYGSQNTLRNTDKLDVSFKLRQKTFGRIDIRNELSYSYDYLKGLSHQFEDVLGLNYVVFALPHFRYSIGPGLAVQYSQPSLGGGGYKLLGDISHEFTWQITNKISLKQTASYLYQPADMRDYRLRANSVLSGQVSDHMSVNLRYEYEFEAIRPVPDGRSDNRVFTTLGYTF